MHSQKSQLYGLVLVTGPASEPVTIEQARAHLRLAEDSPELSEVESIWLPAAREAIELETDLRFVSQTVKLTLDRFPFGSFNCSLPFPVVPSFFELPLYPVTAVSSVKYLDLDGVEQTLSTSAYSADVTRRVARIALNAGYSWPATKAAPGAVRVQYVVGFANAAAVPTTLKAAVLLQTEAMYEGTAGDGIEKTVERLVNLHLTGSLDVKT